MSNSFESAQKVVLSAINSNKIVDADGVVYDEVEIIEVLEDFIDGFESVVVVAKFGDSSQKFKITKDNIITQID